MLFNSISSAATAALFLAGRAVAAPTSGSQLPNDGFPNPSAAQLTGINDKADGTLSNAPPPPALNSSSIPVFQLIAFNENFEVAYFNSLVYNITNNVSGFELPSEAEKKAILGVFETVLAQEELHAINAASVVQHFGGFVPTPCVYKFPTTDLAGAISLAETFTAVVLGTLQDAAQTLAKNGDNGPVRAVASVIGQEGEQNGFYRSLLNRKPSEKPFLTTSVGAFAFSALQQFIVSCPFPLSNIPITPLPPLNVVSGSAGADVTAQDQVLTFTADLTGSSAAAPYLNNPGASQSGLFITYLSGQDTPISEPVKTATWDNGCITVTADFPFAEFVLDGLTIAALTTAQNFSSPDDVPAKTLAAPGLIQVNDPLFN